MSMCIKKQVRFLVRWVFFIRIWWSSPHLFTPTLITYAGWLHHLEDPDSTLPSRRPSSSSHLLTKEESIHRGYTRGSGYILNSHLYIGVLNHMFWMLGLLMSLKSSGFSNIIIIIQQPYWISHQCPPTSMSLTNHGSFLIMLPITNRISSKNTVNQLRSMLLYYLSIMFYLP